ncbi:MAG: 2-keto-4-pentenoate hydratase [Bacillota bacterium]|nr:MAG: 2-hydroxypenta-2,4-dienoate hydratase [Bacillota bacterium]
MPEQPVTELARLLDEAWERRQPVPPLSETHGLRTAEEAYAVQSAWTELRRARGERVVGRKIGLTSRAMQEQLGVGEPDYGSLWASRYFPAAGGRVTFPASLFLQPRVEGEIAFLIGRRLQGPGVTLQEVLAATEAVAPAIEVVDSRIADWRITLADTVADNASFGAFTLGPWSRQWLHRDLRLTGMLVSHNGVEAVQGVGAAALGHPARAVAWLANKLAEFGIGLEPGDIVLSGALGRAVPVAPGDTVSVEFDGQPALAARFE